MTLFGDGVSWLGSQLGVSASLVQGGGAPQTVTVILGPETHAEVETLNGDRAKQRTRNATVIETSYVPALGDTLTIDGNVWRVAEIRRGEGFVRLSLVWHSLAAAVKPNYRKT